MLRFIRHFVFLIDGYTQQNGHDTGMMRLWAMLFLWRDERPGLRTMIMPREWNDDVDAMVSLVVRHAASSRRVIIAGYSYGGGWTAPRLARALGGAGVEVDLMLLIDPVWRSRLISLKWLSLTGAIEVRIPGNVSRVVAWRQSSGGVFDPKGSRLVLDDPARTKIIAEDDLSSPNVDHSSLQFDPRILRDAQLRIIDEIEKGIDT